ncbi:MAG: twin-arginine translocase subunit TatB [Xanthomonadales bacterium]|nr:twin-arginine translocase subunit TatB [Xanthomonadales bacterium]NIN60440.1 twin-arginine translocase subunit TatB [Xanthomonadales bacterium]NIN75793.1 twin-arginine translocase subunit TatB [Xanthomonadales bacterium]NIO12971.1 twin-arginine translocase subunit TatB [Xanthomonadales bacterium]NIP12833.1 twin-arginine translocase subunit TatB [Xanthomonadales bacterium]
MFDVGFAEIFLLALIGLLVLGPERLPRVARTLGGLMRKARSSWITLRRSIEAELAAAEIKEPLESAGQELKDVAEQLEEMGAPPGARAQARPPDGADD